MWKNLWYVLHEQTKKTTPHNNTYTLTHKSKHLCIEEREQLGITAGEKR